MPAQKSNTAPSTSSQILETAVPIFAEKGYRDATCAEISKRANVNIASINYHFGSKENLYRLSLRRAFELADAKYPFHGNLPEKASSPEKLRACMEALIRRNFDLGPAGDLNRMISHQASRPTAPHNMVMQEITELQGNYLFQIIKDIIGNLPMPLLQAAKMNIIALCIFPSLAPAMKKFLFPASPTPDELDEMIERQFQFAQAGLNTLKAG